jgi:hypothetical protein
MDRKEREIFELMMGWDEESSKENADENDFIPFPDGWTILNLQNKIDLLKNLKGYNDDYSIESQKSRK